MRILIPMLLAALGGCATPTPRIEYVTIAQEVRPAVPASCRKRNPPRPVISGGKARDIAHQIGAADTHIDTLEALRDECRAGLGG